MGQKTAKPLHVLSLKIFLVLIANSVDLDEMQHHAAFHLGLHCLPKYLFRGFQYTKGKAEFYTCGHFILYLRNLLKLFHKFHYEDIGLDKEIFLSLNCEYCLICQF